MSITQPPKPPDIKASTWHAIGAMYILKFLVPLQGAYLYYSVMGADPDKKRSRTEEMRAKNVDRILDLQAAEFLAQSSKTFDFDEKTSTPYRRGAQKPEEEEGPHEIEDEETEGDGLAEAAVRYLRSTLTPKKPQRPDEEGATTETTGQTDVDGNFEATKWIKPPPEDRQQRTHRCHERRHRDYRGKHRASKPLVSRDHDLAREGASSATMRLIRPASAR